MIFAEYFNCVVVCSTTSYPCDVRTRNSSSSKSEAQSDRNAQPERNHHIDDELEVESVFNN